MKKKLTIFIIIIAFLAIFLYLQNNWICLSQLEITSEKLPGGFDGFRIVQLSDLHSKAFGRDQERLSKIIAGARPDIIVITGDLVDGRHYEEKSSLTLVKKAAEIAPVYYVTGNHEWWSGKFPGLESKIRDAGAVILRNDSRELSIGEQSIYVTGLDDPESTGSNYNEAGYIEGRLHATIPLLPRDSFKLLLSHRPEAFYLYSGYGVDLVFSGHAHGGQFRLPFIGGLYAPDQGYFPKFTSGIYKDGDTAMVVSRGLGNSVIPQRLFNRPEIVLVTLHATAAGNVGGEEGKDVSYNQSGTAARVGLDKQVSEMQVVGGQSSDNQDINNQTTDSETESLVFEAGKTVQERITAPEGFERIKLENGSFGDYLRSLPLKPHGSKVMYYNGETKPLNVYEAVLDIDVGKRDLQQCADSVIRLRAEYLYGIGQFDKISFYFTNGFKADYSTWMKGNRIKVSGNKASWIRQGEASDSYESFRKYLDMVFSYAGTLSLSKEMKAVSVEEMLPGDVFISGGTPGHCEIVLDMAVNKETGEKRFILAQGYMPAQDMQILKNPGNGDGNPWYSTNSGGRLETPEWEFSMEQLMRFAP